MEKCYVVIWNDVYGKRHECAFSNQRDAIDFYKANMRSMVCGYISDTEALTMGAELVQSAEAEMVRRSRPQKPTIPQDELDRLVACYGGWVWNCVANPNPITEDEDEDESDYDEEPDEWWE